MNTKGHKNQLKTKYQDIISKMKQKLCLDNIYREFQLIANMNKYLQIKLNVFQLLEPLKTLTKEEVIHVISCIPFLKYYKKVIAQVEHQIVQLVYPNDLKTLLITGIHQKSVQKMLNQYNQLVNKKYTDYRFYFAKIIKNNGFWVSVEAHSQEIAFYLKKFLRNYKRSMDETDNKHIFRIERRRIRIVILKEDLFTLLIDAMTQIKAQNFLKQFILPNNNQQKRKSNELPHIKLSQEPKTSLKYKPLLAHLYQNFGRSQIKDEQYSDGFSQSNSLNSDILDSNKLKDLIQTSDQGIQAQNYDDFPLLYDQNTNIKEQNLSESNSPLREYGNAKETDKQSSESFKLNTSEQNIEKVQEQAITQQNIEDKQVEYFGQEKSNRVQQDEDDEDQPIDLDKQQDDPFIRIPKPMPGYNNYSTAIQTHEKIFSQISFQTMKRLFTQFKRSKKSNLLIELPQWVKSESQEERSRHRYYQSLCRPNKIIQKRAFIQ